MPYYEIRRMIVEVDEDQLTEPMIQVQLDLHKVIKKWELVSSRLKLFHDLTYNDHRIVCEI